MDPDVDPSPDRRDNADPRRLHGGRPGRPTPSPASGRAGAAGRLQIGTGGVECDALVINVLESDKCRRRRAAAGMRATTVTIWLLVRAV
jgi:hypothetical protein